MSANPYESENHARDEDKPPSGPGGLGPLDPVEPPETPPRGTARKRGRPQGKRSDPTYVLACAYIPAQLRQQVKIALIKADLEYSELVAQLLREWLERQT
ncbi:hypothetical protein [Gloeobacter morelensis]|uniref:CopG family transcriptional regulator n=1 Tax=Gloeobacter morelensis MG652769 TaxID=2781736 RepID=A0ABY3PKS4_9CYAN|nr:hypothetical protein [Gloeobacter morelensis]UFP94243.1 hypothetical protein ISF26_21210 [Gloeobacter morelensis MG652769]